jgi:hypothetical protein
MKKEYIMPSVIVIELEMSWKLMAGSNYRTLPIDQSEDANEDYEIL